MHKNSFFNIVQAAGNGNPNFVVIDGKRTDSGHLAHGAKIVSEAMPRDDAITLADKLEAIAKTYESELHDAVGKLTPAERRYACDAAHARYEEACAALGVNLLAEVDGA